jgi:hypothetical protein
MLACLASAAFVSCHTESESSAAGGAAAQDGFQIEFAMEQRTFLAEGQNPFFVLEPGFQLELASDEGHLTITVLDETRKIGNVTARVVEEREEENGKLVEVSRNFFAICKQTNDVFYFGEEVDVYKDGKISGHPGAWLAGERGARAGLVAPGAPKVGAKYYQEFAPGVAMDRAEIVDVAATLKTPAGLFKNCLRTHESTGLDKKESEYKLYAPGIGLIQDEDLLLVAYRSR